MNKERIQSIIITLDDGSVHQFSGKACCEVGEHKVIKDIKFTEPRDLPQDVSFTKLEND